MTSFRRIAPVLAVTAAMTLPATAKTVKEFVAEAVKGDNSEIALGQLVLNKAADSQVKSFAQTLVEDHTKGKAQAAAVAQKLGVQPPEGVSPEAQQEMSRLQNLSGAQFDSEFIRFMVKDHQKDVEEFREVSTSGSGPTQQFASQTLPVLEKHLQIAKSLESGK